MKIVRFITLNTFTCVFFFWLSLCIAAACRIADSSDRKTKTKTFSYRIYFRFWWSFVKLNNLLKFLSAGFAGAVSPLNILQITVSQQLSNTAFFCFVITIIKQFKPFNITWLILFFWIMLGHSSETIICTPRCHWNRGKVDLWKPTPSSFYGLLVQASFFEWKRIKTPITTTQHIKIQNLKVFWI